MQPTTNTSKSGPAVLKKDWMSFSCNLLHDRSRAKAKPLAFAVMIKPFVQIAHGFRQMALEVEDHAFNGVLGCFLGDQIIMSFQGNTVIQEPDFVALRNPNSLQGISTKTAADSAIQCIGDQMGDFVNKNVRGNVLDLPLCLPLPLSWVPYFLEKRRVNHEAYLHVSKNMELLWEGSNATSTMVLGWFRAACTCHTLSPDYSMRKLSHGPWPISKPSSHGQPNWRLRANLSTMMPGLPPRTKTRVAHLTTWGPHHKQQNFTTAS
jgi:hypothetical protein